MLDPTSSEKIDLSDITFAKIVAVGHVNKSTTEEEMNEQIILLNRCLQELPKGRIIGKNVSTFTFNYEDLPSRFEQTTYHIGWKRKPHWLDEQETKS